MDFPDHESCASTLTDWSEDIDDTLQNEMLQEDSVRDPDHKFVFLEVLLKEDLLKCPTLDFSVWIELLENHCNPNQLSSLIWFDELS